MSDKFSRWSLVFHEASLEDAYRNTFYLIQISSTLEAARRLIIVWLMLMMFPLKRRALLGIFMVLGYCIRAEESGLGYRLRFLWLMMLRLLVTMICVNGCLEYSTSTPSLMTWLLSVSFFPLFICPQFFFPLPFTLDLCSQIIMIAITTPPWILQISEDSTFRHEAQSFMSWIVIFTTHSHLVKSELDTIMTLMFVHIGFGSFLSCLTTYVRDGWDRAEFWNLKSSGKHIAAVEYAQGTTFKCICIWIGCYHLWFLVQALLGALFQDTR